MSRVLHVHLPLPTQPYPGATHIVSPLPPATSAHFCEGDAAVFLIPIKGPMYLLFCFAFCLPRYSRIGQLPRILSSSTRPHLSLLACHSYTCICVTECHPVRLEVPRGRVQGSRCSLSEPQSLTQGPAHVFCIWPNRKYFRLCWP